MVVIHHTHRFCFGYAFKSCMLVTAPFIHIPRGEVKKAERKKQIPVKIPLGKNNEGKRKIILNIYIHLLLSGMVSPRQKWNWAVSTHNIYV